MNRTNRRSYGNITKIDDKNRLLCLGETGMPPMAAKKQEGTLNKI